jgi:hypothetical protein
LGGGGVVVRKDSKFKIVVRWIGRLMVALGAVTFLVGVGFAIETATFVLRAKHAAAIILRLDERENDDGVQYTPVFTFTASDGKQYTVRAIVASDPPAFEVGESADILYVPSKPSGARIASWWQLWFVSLVLGILAVIHGFLGGCLAYLARPNPTQSLPA